MPCLRADDAVAATRRVLQHVTLTGMASLHSGSIGASLALRVALLAFPQTYQKREDSS